VPLDALLHLLERGKHFSAQTLQIKTLQVHRGKAAHAEHGLHRARARRARPLANAMSTPQVLPLFETEHANCT
jgi:hypothetical protein